MGALENGKPSLVNTLGGETRQGWDDTNRLPERLESFSELKHRTLEFASWAIEGGVDLDRKTKALFKKILACGEYLIFRNYLVSQRSRLLGSCSCKQHLLCAYCASRRGVRNSAVYKERFDFLRDSNKNLYPMFLTFTVKNGPDLMERFNHLRSSMQALLKRRNRELKANTRHTHHTEMSALEGGVFAYEFKRGTAGEWHPHIHMLALVPLLSGVWINLEQLKAEWFELTGDSHVLNVKHADDNGFLEVFAYALKFSEMTNPDRWFAYNELRGERLISSFGSLRGVEVPDEDSDDLLDSDEPFIDSMFRWFADRGYKLHKEFHDVLSPPAG